MSKTMFADYDPDRNTLTLEEPLEGIKEHIRVKVEIEALPTVKPIRRWMKHRGVLDEESGREIAAAIREAFGRDNIEV